MIFVVYNTKRPEAPFIFEDAELVSRGALLTDPDPKTWLVLTYYVGQGRTDCKNLGDFDAHFKRTMLNQEKWSLQRRVNEIEAELLKLGPQ